MKIAVIGLGKAGLPLAGVIADSGLDVIGVDIDEKRCEDINSGRNPVPEERGLDELIEKHGGKGLTAVSSYEDARGCEAYIIIVPLFIDGAKNPDFGILEAAFRGVGRIMESGDLVVLETTVPPMTTEKLAKRWLEEESGLTLESGEFFLAHSPERIMTGFSISRLREFPKVIGGVNPESGVKAFDIYKKFIPNLRMVSSARVAEFIKVIEGCYRDVNIALANELFKIADELEIDFYEARKYANHEYCYIHMPSTGVGGHCIPVYPWFLIKEMERREKYDYSTILRVSREINDQMINYWLDKIVLACMKIDKPIDEIKICIRGITFRDGVKELYHSRNLALARLLREKGLKVYVSDELFSREEIEKLGLDQIEPGDADVVFDPFRLEVTIK
ncbi:MAG: nucleotide sugar dehydrogenase [Candidatus Syntrophoarchaeum sp. WYZ-LMO15]|nr:MAG: nucleotide sugar dehydrogenase [Candidatus Syntrophoarchaeum sp. WYZ-LMO15]